MPAMRPTTLLAVLALLLQCAAYGADTSAPRPNILWITSEDNGPHLGCYGDAYATTPHLDALATRGLTYLHCWSNAPVCAPARTAIISGVYPTSTGSEHMRSSVPMPGVMRMYPQILREAGYYCTNNSKEDYNLEKRGKVWDESSPRAHWKNRKPGQPFFAVFNHTVTHESQIRRQPHTLKHDPAKARVPAYHPDIPEVRRAWAQYYDQLTEMDALAGKNLRELEEAGLADDTIVFYYGDHGSGLPRNKRSACNSGLQVPLIIHVPEKFKQLAPKDYAPGGKTKRLVQFVDFAPTLLSLVGLKAPEWMQGRAFMGAHEAAPNEFLFGFRGRMDERPDLVRSVFDRRYVYVRNYMPHIPAGQHNAYMFQTPMTVAWKKQFDAGKLPPAQAQYWQAPRAAEELYDLESDPDEVNNLAASPDHRDDMSRLRKANAEHIDAVRDVGFLPEGEIHSRSAGSTPYDAARQEGRIPLNRIHVAAAVAARADADGPALGADAFRDADSAVRYWAALGTMARGEAGVRHRASELRAALADESPHVRAAAAEALGRHGSDEDCTAALPVLLDLADVKRHDIYVAVAALNALDALDRRAMPVKDKIAALPESDPAVINKMKEYVPRLKEAILEDLN
jgi:uncharacterized sulfatase